MWKTFRLGGGWGRYIQLRCEKLLCIFAWKQNESCLLFCPALIPPGLPFAAEGDVSPGTGQGGVRDQEEQFHHWRLQAGECGGLPGCWLQGEAFCLAADGCNSHEGCSTLMPSRG